MKWQPIETCPCEDDETYLGWCDYVRFIYVGYHNGEKRFYDSDALLDSANYCRVYPTHWMHVPKGPND